MPDGVCLPTRCAIRASKLRSFLDFPFAELQFEFAPRENSSFFDGVDADAVGTVGSVCGGGRIF